MASIQLASCTIFVLLTLFLNDKLPSEANKMTRKDVMLPKSKGTVRTIKSEDGDIVDCVDIYKQPAFEHPLLKNHKIEDIKLKPRLGSKRTTERNSHLNVSQRWQTKGQCPKGTIPIRRTRNLLDFKKTSPDTKSSAISEDSCPHEYASVTTDRQVYFGAHGQLNVWNPLPEPEDFSLSQMWVTYDVEDAPLETMEVGWHVFPEFYGDTNTRLFIYWTRDQYVSTGCYNSCPGFVQTSQNIMLGGTITTSTYNGPQVVLTVDIYKENGNWVLVYNDNEIIGYWPPTIFDNLKTISNRVEWGGEIINCNPMHHTTTPMGSGSFPSGGGFGRASFIRGMEILDIDWNWDEPETVELRVTHPGCYDLSITDNADIFFGGPGYSPACQ